MASALDAVLQIRQSEQDQRNLQQQQIMQVFQNFQQARQFNAQQQLAGLQTKIGAAQSGIGINPDGTLRPDQSLMNPLSRFIQMGQVYDANNKIKLGGGQGMDLSGYGVGGNNNNSGGQGVGIGNVSLPNQQTNDPSVTGADSQNGTNNSDYQVASQKLNVAGVPTETEIKNTSIPIKEEFGKKNLEGNVSTNQLLGALDRNVADYKSAIIQQGGAGPLRESVGATAANKGQAQTGAISAFEQSNRDLAIQMTHALTGGTSKAQGTFFQILNHLGSLHDDPSNYYTTAASIGANFHILQNALQKAGYDMNKFSLDPSSPGLGIPASKVNQLFEQEKKNVGLDGYNKLLMQYMNHVSDTIPSPVSDQQGKPTVPQTTDWAKNYGNIPGVPHNEKSYLPQLQKQALQQFDITPENIKHTAEQNKISVSQVKQALAKKHNIPVSMLDNL